MIGTDIKPAEVKRILTDLGFTVKAAGKNLSVTPPAWRNDVTMKQDIVEEVARIYGYANVKPAMPEASITPPERETWIHTVRDSLSESGAIEMLHLAFTSPEQLKRWSIDPMDAVSIENPIGEEISLMRPALLPSLIETAARELKNTNASHLKVYETGRVFRPDDEHGGFCYAVLAKGKTTITDEPLLIAKADILRALKAAGYEATLHKGTVPAGFAHEGRSAEIMVEGELIGHLFELHPSIRATLGLTGRVAVVTIGLYRLVTLTPKVMVVKPLPVFPAITFDETVPLTGKRPYADLVKSLKAIDPLLTEIETVNVYEKENLKTQTLHFTYRSPDRTLTQEEVEKVHGKVVAELKKSA